MPAPKFSFNPATRRHLGFAQIDARHHNELEQEITRLVNAVRQAHPNASHHEAFNLGLSHYLGKFHQHMPGGSKRRLAQRFMNSQAPTYQLLAYQLNFLHQELDKEIARQKFNVKAWEQKYSTPTGRGTIGGKPMPGEIKSHELWHLFAAMLKHTDPQYLTN